MGDAQEQPEAPGDAQPNRGAPGPAGTGRGGKEPGKAGVGKGGKETADTPVGKDWGREVTNDIGMKLVRIPKGTFLMGYPAGDEDRSAAECSGRSQSRAGPRPAKPPRNPPGPL